LLSAALLVAATAVLLVAVLRQDYGIKYVAAQSRGDSSTWYRIAALWSGSEGSLLLFSAMLAVVVAIVVTRRPLAPLGAVAAVAMLALLSVTIGVFANPFSTAELPAVRGAGLTPILEHPAMIYHPPILYAGLVATAAPFLLIVGAIRDLGAARRWALAAWTLLTVGLATGANWAYVELGWGGYWAWDPVENTVLMPWLVLTAALHAWHVRDRSPVLVRSLLAAPFVLVAFGSAVTRSGGLSSVHVFADADSLGIALGALVAALALVLSVHLVAARVETAETVETVPTVEAIETVETTVTSASRSTRPIVLAAVASLLLLFVVVLLGVGFPLLPGNDRILDPTYYTTIGAPLLVVALLAMGLAPSSWALVRSAAGVRVLLGAVVGVFLGVAVGAEGWFSLTAAAGVGAVVAGHLRREQLTAAKLSMTLAHIGLAVLAIGVAGSAQADSTRTALAPGEDAQLGDYLLTYESFAVTDGPRLATEQSIATVAVTRSGDAATSITLEPGLVSYPSRAVVLAETSLHSTPTRDVQVVMRTIAQDGTASFDFAVRPGVMLVWWGATLIALAGLVAFVRSSSVRATRATARVSQTARSGSAYEQEAHQVSRSR